MNSHAGYTLPQTRVLPQCQEPYLPPLALSLSLSALPRARAAVQYAQFSGASNEPGFSAIGARGAAAHPLQWARDDEWRWVNSVRGVVPLAAGLGCCVTERQNAGVPTHPVSGRLELFRPSYDLKRAKQGVFGLFLGFLLKKKFVENGGENAKKVQIRVRLFGPAPPAWTPKTRKLIPVLRARLQELEEISMYPPPH